MSKWILILVFLNGLEEGAITYVPMPTKEVCSKALTVATTQFPLRTYDQADGTKAHDYLKGICIER
jgi:hypothetical protein